MGYIKNICIYTDADDSSDEAEANQPQFRNDCLVEDFEEEVQDRSDQYEQEDVDPEVVEHEVDITQDGEADDELVEDGKASDGEEVLPVTAKGTARVRKIKWSTEEHYALFIALFKNEEALRATGPGTQDEKDAAWGKVLGNYFNLIFILL